MKLIEHEQVIDLSTWHAVCSSGLAAACGTIGAMKKVHVVFHDGGGGHRNAAVALQTVISQQQRDWQIELIQFQDLTDRLDVLRKLTGIRIQQQYNILLQSGWTLGSTYLLRLLQATIRIFHGPLVNLLERFWREKPADLLISVIPHFNRQICESWTKVYPGRPFVTIITDLADFPPRFWIEPIPDQYVIAGTEKAAAQARAMDHDDAHIFLTSGMILRPDFLIGKPGPGSVAEAMVRKLPVLIECNAWTLPQERYNAEWVKEKGVGIVLKSFEDVAEGVRRMLDPAALAAFRRNVAAEENHAVFEIPEILAKLLGELPQSAKPKEFVPVA